jgi:hypothetical protein
MIITIGPGGVFYRVYLAYEFGHIFLNIHSPPLGKYHFR